MCIKTNDTPHNRLFSHSRKIQGFKNSKTIPGWLNHPRKLLLNNHNADPPLIQEVKLIDLNREIAHVKLPSGKDVAVKIKDFTPIL